MQALILALALLAAAWSTAGAIWQAPSDRVIKWDGTTPPPPKP